MMRMKLRYLLVLIGCLLSLYILLVVSRRNAESDHRFEFHQKIKGKNFHRKSVKDEVEGSVNLPHSEDASDLSRPPPNRDGRRLSLPRGKLSEISRQRQQMVSGVTCFPRENITFIKVHKTGSSTVQNIFLRYGDKHNLQFVLPPSGHHLGYPDYFDEKHFLHNEQNNYNMFCHHTRFSSVIPRIMPRNTYYITIVRDPASVFESAFIYFKMDYRLGMSQDPDALEKFLDDSETYYKNQVNKVHMKNAMLYDLGVPLEDFQSEQAMKRAIKTFQKRFRLVMVAEYFEESLILLRDLLCWTTDDVVVFKMNTRKDDSIVPLSEETKSKIRDWNNGDVLLYEHFNRTLQRKINDYGRDRMAREVAILREKTQELYSKCIESDHADKEHGDFKVWQPFGVHINAFVLKADQKGNKECERMIIPEIQYTKELRQKQFPDYKPHDQFRFKPIKNKRRAGIPKV